MNSKKGVAFEVFGNFGHFRKIFTTTSPLTYAFPPPTALAGIVGAVCGLSKHGNEYLKYFNSKEKYFAVELVNPVKKIRLGINYNNTKDLTGDKLYRIIYKKNHIGRTQIPVEFLKNPHFVIYFTTENEDLLSKFSDLIKENRSVYTVSLGLAYLLANVRFVGEFEAQEINGSSDYVKIHSVIPLGSVAEKGISLEKLKENRLGKESIMPFSMTPERKTDRIGDVIYDMNAKPIFVKVEKYWKINGKNVIFL